MREKLLKEATDYCEKHQLRPESQTVALMAAFALAQLREQLSDLERRGLLRHKEDCAAIPKAHFGYRGVEKVEGPCSCGWDEIRLELGESEHISQEADCD